MTPLFHKRGHIGEIALQLETFFLGRLAVICFLAFGLFLLQSPAHAGQVQLIKNAVCDVLYHGEVEQGDSDKIFAALDSLDRSARPERARLLGEAVRLLSVPTLCLNSNGGSFNEAVSFAKRSIKMRDFLTIVESGSECYSACALIFLAGHQNHGDGTFELLRRISVGGRLGFHAPYIRSDAPSSEKLLDASFHAGVLAVAELLDLNPAFYPRSLMSEFLRKGSNELFLIDRVGHLAAWQIGLLDYKRPASLDEAQIHNICGNAGLESRIETSLEPYMRALFDMPPSRDVPSGRTIPLDQKTVRREVEPQEDAGCSVLLRLSSKELQLNAALGTVGDGDGFTSSGGLIRWGFKSSEGLPEIGRIDPDSFYACLLCVPTVHKDCWTCCHKPSGRLDCGLKRKSYLDAQWLRDEIAIGADHCSNGL